MRDGSGAGNDDGVFGNDEREIAGGGVDGVANEIVDGDGAIEDGTGAEDGAALDDGAFVDAGVAADEDVVFDDDGKSADGFEDAANLRGGGDVAVAADLRARADERVGIKHGVFADVCADIDEHRRHTDDATGDVRSVADAGASGNDADAIGDGERVERVSGLVEKRKFGGVDRHIYGRAHAEAEENSLLDPGVGAPAGGRGRIGFGGADRAAIQGVLEIGEEGVVLRRVAGGRSIEQGFNLFVAA